MNAVKKRAKVIIKIIIRVLLFMYAEDYEKAPLDARDTAYGGGIRGFFRVLNFFMATCVLLAMPFLITDFVESFLPMLKVLTLFFIFNTICRLFRF
jgi:hypothetical protein